MSGHPWQGNAFGNSTFKFAPGAAGTTPRKQRQPHANSRNPAPETVTMIVILVDVTLVELGMNGEGGGPGGGGGGLGLGGRGGANADTVHEKLTLDVTRVVLTVRYVKGRMESVDAHVLEVGAAEANATSVAGVHVALAPLYNTKPPRDATYTT
jgi:hypothetical protein